MDFRLDGLSKDAYQSLLPKSFVIKDAPTLVSFRALRN